MRAACFDLVGGFGRNEALATKARTDADETNHDSHLISQ
jgi:hypothetical protein